MQNNQVNFIKKNVENVKDTLSNFRKKKNYNNKSS